jgi:anti-anti-sigma regulatory factor
VPFSIDSTLDTQTLTLQGAVTIRHAQDLAATLGEALDKNTALTIATADLVDVDTCILQLLCALRKSVPALVFDEPSMAFVAAVDRSGLRRELLSGREDL